MTKNEIINEIKSVVMNNGGEVKGTHSGSLRFFIGENGELFMQRSACCNYHKDVVKNMKYLTKSQLERCLSDIKFYVEKYYNTKAETVETEVENTENTVEVEKNDNNVKNMTKNEIINKIEKFMGNVDYFHYFKFMNGKNETKTSLNCVLIGDDGIMYYRHFGDCDRIHFKKLNNCRKAELIAIDGVCKLYVDHMNSRLSKAA